MKVTTTHEQAKIMPPELVTLIQRHAASLIEQRLAEMSPSEATAARAALADGRITVTLDIYPDERRTHVAWLIEKTGERMPVGNFKWPEPPVNDVDLPL